MPKYFFDLQDGSTSSQDQDGEVLADREAARRECLVVLTEMIDSARPDGNLRDFTVTVRDEAGQPVFTATMSLRAKWLD